MNQIDKIAQDVEQLRIQFPKTTDLYREVCILLFFRYGMQPTANMLYQLVRKGTMSTPANVLNQFWKDLREKSRIHIDHPGLPENLRSVAAELLSTLWRDALSASETSFSSKYIELNDAMTANKLELEKSNEVMRIVAANQEKLEIRLENANKLLAEAENKTLVDTQVLTMQEKSLITLQHEKSILEAELMKVHSNFSEQSNNLHESLVLSDLRYRSLEAKALLDVDRERQQVVKLTKELVDINKLLVKERSSHAAQLIKQQKVIDSLREKVGVAKGQLKESQREFRVINKRLKKPSV